MQSRITLLSKKIIDTFTKENLSLAGAESCTGGAIASAIVSISGASQVFKGTTVCYCDTAKHDILNVSGKTLELFYAESQQCAEEMAKGALNMYKADISYATTGFLDSNTGFKPIDLAGVVYLSVAKKSGEIFTKKLQLNPNNERNVNRAECVLNALQTILNKI